ncbi:MAG TPA: sensor domain-containing diguanylate cyclase [Solirubrobacterales bacterium]|nr:sensor domain-containing diguanylate cyclase [Solirubrobacterales bacterium]
MRENIRRAWGAHGGLAQLGTPATMALALGALFVAGAVIGGLSLLLPHPSGFDGPALWSNVGLAFAGGLALIALHRVLPMWAIQVAVLVGTLVITRAVYYGHDASGFYTVWYLWVGVYALFFFGRRWGAVHLAAIGAAYAWALVVLDSSTPIARWVVTIGSIAVVAALVGMLAERLRRETTAAANRAANLEAVGEVAHQLATRSDPRAVGSAVCTAALNATGASAAVLWGLNPSGSGLVATAAAGAEIERTSLPFITPNSGALQAFTTGAERFSVLGGDDDGAQELGPLLRASAGLWQPVMSKEAVVGVLAVYWRGPLPAVGDEPRQAMRLLALEASIAIERGNLLGRLQFAASTDDLTGLHDRRAWNAELRRGLARAERDRAPLCVAVLDLDRFKEFNDQHGHQAGDRFLKQMAGIWSTELRGTDVLARHGGEEFALAMPGTTIDSARRKLERLCAATPEGQTCSAGVCAWDGEEGPEALLARADGALYDAKAAGRNRVIAG